MTRKKLWVPRAITGFLLSVAAMTIGSAKAFAEPSNIERGRYLTIVGGCNDCHTPGYALSSGKVPEKDWLKGDPLGWHGPWGTTYAINLRKLVAQLAPRLGLFSSEIHKLDLLCPPIFFRS